MSSDKIILMLEHMRRIINDNVRHCVGLSEDGIHIVRIRDIHLLILDGRYNPASYVRAASIDVGADEIIMPHPHVSPFSMPISQKLISFSLMPVSKGEYTGVACSIRCVVPTDSYP